MIHFASHHINLGTYEYRVGCNVDCSDCTSITVNEFGLCSIDGGGVGQGINYVPQLAITVHEQAAEFIGSVALDNAPAPGSPRNCWAAPTTPGDVVYGGWHIDYATDDVRRD